MDMSSENKDLVWDLEAFHHRQRAVDFVMGFENKMCVFSESVEQLYTNYNIFFPKEENRRLVILPNPYAHHDVFQGVPPGAVKATRLNVISGEIIGKRGLYLTIPTKGAKTKYKAVPLRVGLSAINKQRDPSNPLLPVLKKGDLRELEAKTPCLHLHTLNINLCENMSGLDRQGIQKVITERLSLLA